ncbi:hypothetical protein JRO89_XS04G0208100 [Xanthoceras sorbifolium]|uniref:LOB domain-containing protein n=1 Tax=Xanthoceras sorbifolium TaxID=99658 RepID=A0ABQ8I678_9ROSI|nr:hypothetical protein JRO89_XS04G0208100 [Xanthoceras sorbifolium]
MAQYFPASRYSELQNAYRLFGMINIQRMINCVPPKQRKAAAESILIEGNARSNDPVNGCLGIVRDLKSQINLYENEREVVNRQLAFFRERKGDEHRENLRGSSSSSSTKTPLKFENDFDGFTPPTVAQSPNIDDDLTMIDHILDFQSTMDEGLDQPTMEPFQFGTSEEQTMKAANNSDEEEKKRSSYKGKKPMSK